MPPNNIYKIPHPLLNMAKKSVKEVTTTTVTKTTKTAPHKPKKKATRKKTTKKKSPSKKKTIKKKAPIHKKEVHVKEKIVHVPIAVKAPTPKTKTQKTLIKSNPKLEEQIIQNLVALQKVNIDLAEKFESLTEQLSNLLALFEMSARTFAKNPAVQMIEKDKEFLNKIDRLLDQNKTIAKGLTLMEAKMREKLYGPIIPPSENKPPRRAPPRF